VERINNKKTELESGWNEKLQANTQTSAYSSQHLTQDTVAAATSQKDLARTFSARSPSTDVLQDQN